jgi:glutathione peroxidase
MSTKIYDILLTKTNGTELPFSTYEGKVVLVVNTATKCGLAPQFEELEELWNTYSHDDFVILGFPCDQFAGQEPESDDTVEAVCRINF